MGQRAMKYVKDDGQIYRKPFFLKYTCISALCWTREVEMVKIPYEDLYVWRSAENVNLTRAHWILRKIGFDARILRL